tara:strand:- start:1023 stop:1661 length:639 start_codon:yes stop_codon:yes gene_type:complete
MDIEFSGKDPKKTRRHQPLYIEPFRSKNGKEFYKISGIAEGCFPELESNGALFIVRKIGGIELSYTDAQSLAEGFSLCDKQDNGRDVYIIPRNIISKKRGSALMRVGLAFPIQRKGNRTVLGYTCEGVKFFNNKEKSGITPVLTPKACFELLDAGKTESKDYTLEIAECRSSVWKNKAGKEFPQYEVMYRIKKKAVKHDQLFALRKAVNLGR